MKFKKLSFKKVQKLKTATKKSKREKNSSVNEQALRKAFADCSDVVFSSLKFQQHVVTLVYCKGLISNDMLYKTIPLRLEEFFRNHPNELDESTLHSLNLPALKTVNTIKKVMNDVFSGKLLLLFNMGSEVLSIDISDRPQRKPEESSMEISVKGPRDNFIEDISVNYALIRKRLRTPSLLSETFEIGKRTKTKVSLLYMKDLANPDTIAQIKNRIETIDVDGLYSGTQLEGLINDSPYSFFPQHTYTGRPDFAVQSLLNGRFVILIDGVAYAYLAPVDLFFLLKAAEDSETHFFYNAFQRVMRAFGLSVAAFLPGFWVALTSFHQNQLPFTFLATVIESRKGVPFPTSLEAILMLLLFEVFREAGLRLPLSIGQTLSVIGGLIIGDAAIRAGLTSPAMLVVIAASTIATFTLVNQTLVGAVSLLRFVVIIFSSTLGFFGFFVSIFIIGTYIAKIHSFSIPFLQVAERLSFRNALQAILRAPIQKDNMRPSATKPLDPTKKGENS